MTGLPGTDHEPGLLLEHKELIVTEALRLQKKNLAEKARVGEGESSATRIWRKILATGARL